ncbi:MAG: Ig-like domain repeat protein [Leucobacter sp.]
MRKTFAAAAVAILALMALVSPGAATSPAAAADPVGNGPLLIVDKKDQPWAARWVPQDIAGPSGKMAVDFNPEFWKHPNTFALSDDGSMIVYATPNNKDWGELSVIRVMTAEQEFVVGYVTGTVKDLAISPDNSLIALIARGGFHDDDGYNGWDADWDRMYTLPATAPVANGVEPKMILDSGIGSGLDFDPVTGKIAFGGSGHIGLAEPSTGSVIEFTGTCTWERVHGFGNCPDDLGAINVDGSLSFSPDGNRVLMVGNQSYWDQEKNKDVYDMFYATMTRAGKVTRVLNIPEATYKDREYAPFRAYFSPDGKKIAAALNPGEIVVLPAAGGSATKVASNSTLHGWLSCPGNVCATFAVAKVAPSMSVSVASPVAYGSAPKVSVAMSGSKGTPSGEITVEEGSKSLGTGTLKSGKASIPLPKTLGVGTHTLTVSYAGDGSYKSASKTVTVIVKAAAKLQGTISSTVFLTGEKIRLTASLTTTPKINATGTITVLVDGKKQASKALTAADKNKLNFTLKPLAKGKHTVQMTFTKSPEAMDAKTGKVSVTVYEP